MGCGRWCQRGGLGTLLGGPFSFWMVWVGVLRERTEEASEMEGWVHWDTADCVWENGFGVAVYDAVCVWIAFQNLAVNEALRVAFWGCGGDGSGVFNVVFD